jgi:hypothetical protein
MNELNKNQFLNFIKTIQITINMNELNKNQFY